MTFRPICHTPPDLLPLLTIHLTSPSTPPNLPSNPTLLLSYVCAYLCKYLCPGEGLRTGFSTFKEENRTSFSLPVWSLKAPWPAGALALSLRTIEQRRLLMLSLHACSFGSFCPRLLHVSGPLFNSFCVGSMLRTRAVAGMPSPHASARARSACRVHVLVRRAEYTRTHGVSSLSARPACRVHVQVHVHA